MALFNGVVHVDTDCGVDDALALAVLAEKAGVPKGVLNIITGDAALALHQGSGLGLDLTRFGGVARGPRALLVVTALKPPVMPPWAVTRV